MDEVVQDAVKRMAAGKQPTLVWVFDAEEGEDNDRLEQKVFAGEKIGLALKRFLCLKAEVQSIPSDKIMRETARQCPIFMLFDPAGELYGTLSGKKAGSKSGFSSRVEKLWDVSFEMSLKDYSKRMGKILDQVDKIESQKERLTRKMTSAAGNPGKLRGLQQEEKQLKEEEEKALSAERQLIEACKLRPDFLSTEQVKE